MDPSIFGSDGTDPEEASGVLEPEDTLDDTDGVRDVLDTGWSPPERPWAVDDWGTTESEESAGESLDGRLRREVPDRTEDVGDGLGDSSDTDGELLTRRWGAGAPGDWSTATEMRRISRQSSTRPTSASTGHRRPPRRRRSTSSTGPTTSIAATGDLPVAARARARRAPATGGSGAASRACCPVYRRRTGSSRRRRRPIRR